jgi:type I restriction enzyme M protein
MNSQTHTEIAGFIWSICNLLRGPYKRNEYRKVILPLTVLRRFDCLLAPTKDAALEAHSKIKDKPETVIRTMLEQKTGRPFYNLSKLGFMPAEKEKNSLLDDPNQLAMNLNAYMSAFSPNVRGIMEKFAFEQQITRLAEKNLLYEIVKAFTRIDLSETRVDNQQMGYVFEELIRIGAEQSNEEAGEHFTPREVIKLMVNLLLSPEKDLGRSHIVKTIYDPACGTGGMLSVAEEYIRKLNRDASPHLFGQDYNDEAWAVCKSDMLIKGEDADNIKLGDTFLNDGFQHATDGSRITFDYMLANPPFGVEWKQQQKEIEKEADKGHAGRFGAGLPRINDGSLLFLQHMISKMRDPANGGSRIAVVFNGSPLFTGDAGSGESNIRQWVIENDWLEAVVALPDQLFYNTGISTYIWVLSNRKPGQRQGKVQLIDARGFFIKMKKSLGNKRNKIGDAGENEPDQIGDIAAIYGAFTDGEARVINGKAQVVSKIFQNEAFGFYKITVERPLRLNFCASVERIERLADETAFKNLATSQKKQDQARLLDLEAGRTRQDAIHDLLRAFHDKHGDRVYTNRTSFQDDLKAIEKARGVKLGGPELKAVLSALSERDASADICLDSKGNPESDADLRDTESVPLTDSIEGYFRSQVLPHVPDAWIDHTKTKIGYELPLNRHFYRYEPPRDLAVIEAEIRGLEAEIVGLLGTVTA